MDIEQEMGWGLIQWCRYILPRRDRLIIIFMNSDLQIMKNAAKRTEFTNQNSNLKSKVIADKTGGINNTSSPKQFPRPNLQKQTHIQKYKEVFPSSGHKKIQSEAFCTCGRRSGKSIAAKKLKNLKYDLQLVCKEVQAAQEQVYLLLANFNFILELTAENLNRETAGRIQKILKHKNEIIQKQKQKISLLEQSQLQKSNDKADSCDNLQDRFQEALIRIQQLQNENKTLKDLSSRLQYSANSSINFEDNSDTQKKTSDSSNNGIFPILEEEEENFASSLKLQGNRKYKVKKRNTIGNAFHELASSSAPPEIDIKIQSLGNLKMKIHRLKAELEKGYNIQN